MRYRRIATTVLLMSILLLAAAFASCGEEEPSAAGTGTAKTAATAATSTTPEEPVATGIRLDPSLQSATGIPTPDEMPVLIDLQSKVPYPVTVPTYLPGGYQLDKGLIGYGSRTAADPVGYYSFRYFDPANPNRTMTFNQSLSNRQPLSGYYLTEVTINGTPFQVYWHKTLEYLPAGPPVMTDSVGEAETYVIVWKGQYQDSDGAVLDLYYSLTTGTWTGHGWGTMQEVIAGLKPLAAVGG